MKWKLNLPDPGMTLYYLMKLIGLAPFTVNEDGFHPPTLLDKLYSASVAIGFLIFGVKEYDGACYNARRMEISHVAVIGTLLQYFMNLVNIFSTIIIFLLMHKRIISIAKKLRMIGSELKNLGIEQDERKFFKDAFVTILKTHAILIPILIAVIAMERFLIILISLKYAVEVFIHINTVLAFTQTLLFIKQSFELLNKKLLEIFEPAGDRRSRNHCSSIFVVSRNIADRNQPTIRDFTNLQSLRKIQALYLELCDLVAQTTELFAIPILWKSFLSCTQLIVYNFWIYDSAKKFNQFHDRRTVEFSIEICGMLIRMAIVMVQFFIVADASQETCKEGNSTRAVLFRAWYKSKPRHLENEFIMFSLQLLNKPVTVSAFGLIDLGYSYPYKILCTAVTYVIVLIQLETTKSSTDI